MLTPEPLAVARREQPADLLLRNRRLINVLSGEIEALLDAAHELGSPLHDPFMAMSFMAPKVIPKLKLTDQGLVDVEAFTFVDLLLRHTCRDRPLRYERPSDVELAGMPKCLATDSSEA